MVQFYFRVTVCVGYYALTLNSTKLSGDIVLNYLLATISETPGKE